MTLLENAGEFVLWAMAIVIGVAVIGAATLHAWDWWFVRTWYRRRK
jgi:hypothetical protein